MPLPPAQPQLITVEYFQGIDIEKGVLERAPNSFARLENFDIVKPGVIRKIRGIKVQGKVSNNPVVALRDYQRDPEQTQQRVAVDAQGGLFYAQDISLPWSFVGQLLSPAALLNTAPFVVSLPFDDTTSPLGKRNYIVVTLGNLDFVKKWDGEFGITRLGIPNPTDTWGTTLYQHSAIIPQQLYQSTTLAKQIFIYTSPSPRQGIPISQGRRYRWSWYNPVTGHDSSLAANSLQQFDTNILRTLTNPIPSSKPLGIALTNQDAPYLMAVPIFLDNINNPSTFGQIPIPSPGEGYTQIRFWATRDGQSDYFLVPRLYNDRGLVVTDGNGAVNISLLRYGVIYPSLAAIEVPMLWDGFAPHDLWILPPPQFDDVINYQVSGGGQTGFNLNVVLNAGTNVTRAQFMLQNDSTVYIIAASTHTGGNAYTWQVYPAIVNAPNDASAIQMLQTLPVLDTELTQLFASVGEVISQANNDRINDPPPKASWGVVYANRLFLLNALDPTQLHYSLIDQYESFPPDNVFRFTQSDFDPITALLTSRQVGMVSQGADAQLIVGKERTSAKITGVDPTTFAIQSLYAETGIVHKRAVVVVEGFTVGWTRRGLETLDPQQPFFVGTKIKDLFDQATFGPVGDIFGPSFTTYRTEGELLLGVNLFQGGDPLGVNIDSIFLFRPPISAGAAAIGGQIQFFSPFSMITALAGHIHLGVLLESGFNDDVKVIAGAEDGHVYQLFIGGDVVTANGTTPVVAIAQTQELPQEDKESRKIFRRIRFDGNVITGDLGWKISFSVDGGSTFSPPRQMYNDTLIGLVGRQIIVQIIHDSSVPGDQPAPQISNFSLEYVPIGTSRAGVSQPGDL